MPSTMSKLKAESSGSSTDFIAASGKSFMRWLTVSQIVQTSGSSCWRLHWTDTSPRAWTVSSSWPHCTAQLKAVQGAQDTIKGSEDLDIARKALLLHRHLRVRRLSPVFGEAVCVDGQDFQAAISSLSHCRLPVIVALNGACMGLAIDIASACDIRVASSDAVFAIAVSQ